MARIEDALAQAEIENSLLGDVQEPAEAPPAEQSYSGDLHGDELLNSYMEELEADPLRHGDVVAQERAQQVEESVQDSEQRQSPEQRNERMLSPEEAQELSALQQQPALPSPAEAIEAHGLNDEAANRQLATEWGSALGMTVDEFSKVDSEKVGHAISEMGLAAIEAFIGTNGDLTKIASAVPVQTVVQTLKEPKAGELIRYITILTENQEPFLQERHRVTRSVALETEWENGSRVFGIPGSEHQIRMFHPFVAVFDEMAFMEDAEQCYGAVLPVAKQIIGVSSAHPGRMGDQCSDPGMLTMPTEPRTAPTKRPLERGEYPYPIDRRGTTHQ